MPTLDSTATVGSFVRQRPSRSRVFESLKIDYYCGGKIPLGQACEKKGIDAANVLKQLQACNAATENCNLTDADSMSLTDLADHIEATHHAYLREELPRLDFMTEKVSRVHGDKDDRLFQMREASTERKASHCGSVANPIRQMEHEHDLVGNALAILNESTDGYAPPEWACNTYRAMLDSLSQLERDMHQQIHKENNVLFPKTIELENVG